MEIQQAKQNLSEVMDFADSVRGFDVRDLVDPLEQLESYRTFLGDEEYHKVQQNYSKTIDTMNLVFEAEASRLHTQGDTFTEELNLRNLLGEVEKFQFIFD